MSSVGIVMRADGDVESLEQGWTPEPLGTRSTVLAAIARHFDGNDRTLALAFDVEDAPAPRTVSVSGTWGDREAAILRDVCADLGARFYDPEEGDFIDLDT